MAGVRRGVPFDRGIELGVSANQKDGGELRREIVHLADAEPAKIELIEFTALGKRD